MSKCRACGGEIEWVKIRGKLACYNAGTTREHWDLCSQRKFNRIKETGEYFENAMSAGYYTDLKSSGVQYTMLSSGLKRGARPISKDCGQCVPPWEVCDRLCPNALD